MCICDRMKGIICATHKHERDERYPAPQPLTWAAPEQPGREIEAVRDRHGRRWVRESAGGPSVVWVLYAPGDPEPLDGRFWRNLLHDSGPLVDATDDAEAVSDVH